jgi:LuxR family transcriptional regulator, regulator of acetate metabolism
VSDETAAGPDPVEVEVVRRMFALLRLVGPAEEPDLRRSLVALADELRRTVSPVPNAGLEADFTAREIDTIALVAVGFTNGEIAELLGVSPETVKGYLRNALGKSGTHSRYAVVAAVRRAGRIP